MKELSLHILDIAQNSIAAGADKISVSVREDTEKNIFVFSVSDNGCGMSEDMVRAVEDPFVTGRTTRKVGLGIPLLKAAAENAGGKLTITSRVGEGTSVLATFMHDHIDRQPLGDIAGTMVSLITANDTVRFLYEHIKNEARFSLDTEEIRKILGEVPLSEPEVALWLREYINEGIASLA